MPRRLTTRASRSQPSQPSPPPSTTPEPHLFPDPQSFQTWLDSNHSTSPGIWLRLAKKASTVPAVSYAEALDLALCYGWIDGQKKTYDANHFLQRFTPRRRNSLWSKRNVDKVATLTEQGLMRDSGLREVDAAKGDGRWERAYAGSGTAEIPADLQAALGRSGGGEGVLGYVGEESAVFVYLEA